jgi:hypothetical protein
MTDTVTTGHFTLSQEQRQFKKMLDAYPLLASYWNFETRDCDLQAINADIGALSSGEQHMLRFFVAVWLGENRLHFDLIDATKALGEDNLNDIRAWLNRPVWP